MMMRLGHEVLFFIKFLAFASLHSQLTLLILSCVIRNLDKVLAGGSQFGANQQLYDLY